ncbi:amino acid transporter [Salinibacter sp. 10B]|uniref:amino acid permease n=1 Tax=Salinibacter sp. 10B TaxID=1923971 RepID=UPI000CF4C85D|nr:amino acid permease [Salinibacter sp. 10B]PQJ35295.1 amino acid transporter [Salinibacter sp. 10B]
MNELAKDLGLLEALTIGVGTMIGAGIFVLPGPATAVAGPAVAVSFVIGGVISIFTAMSASELGTAMPKAGGSYYYVNHALGPIFGSIAGLGNWMGLAFASAFYAIGFGSYVAGFLPDVSVEVAGIVFSQSQLYALGAGTLFIAVNYIGAKETGRLQNIIVITLVGILAVFIVACIGNADPATLTPLAPKGWGAVLPATALVFVSFLGFAKITTVAEEIKNPGRNLPLAIIGSVIIVTVIYAVIMLLINAVLPWQEISGNGDIAVVSVGRVVLGGVGVVALTVGGLLATASSANASILASSRINFAMGRDRLVSDWLNAIHEKYATPHRSIALTGGLILLFIMIGDVKTLAKAGSVLHLIVYGLLNLALIVMREADVPEYQPDYTVPFYPVVPIVGAIASFGLIAFMDMLEIALSLVFVVVAVLWFYAYARRNTPKQGVFSRHILDRAEEMPDSAVAAAEAVQPDASRYRVMVPLSNPEHESNLITLASTMARQHDNGTVVAVHIVDVPDQTPLAVAAEHLDELDAESNDLLAAARADAETYGVDVETHTIFSHRVFEEIFDAAKNQRADVVVLGWGPDSHGSPGRVESFSADLLGDLSCDFVVFRDRGFDPSRVLVPTRGGPGSEVSADVARTLRDEYGSEVMLMNVTDDPKERADHELGLEHWAETHGLSEVRRVVDVSSSVDEAIAARAQEHSLLILGATEQGLLSRLTGDLGALKVVEKVDCSVILAETAYKRSLAQRLFGNGRKGFSIPESSETS